MKEKIPKIFPGNNSLLSWLKDSYRQRVKISMVFRQSIGGVVVPAGRALAAPSDSIHAESHGAIAVRGDRLGGVGVPAVGPATVAPQVLATRLQNQEKQGHNKAQRFSRRW